MIRLLLEHLNGFECSSNYRECNVAALKFGSCLADIAMDGYLSKLNFALLSASSDTLIARIKVCLVTLQALLSDKREKVATAGAQQILDSEKLNSINDIRFAVRSTTFFCDQYLKRFNYLRT